MESDNPHTTQVPTCGYIHDHNTLLLIVLYLEYPITINCGFYERVG